MCPKTNWKDIGDLRLPSPKWRLGRAANWYALRLGLPENTIAFINPDGRHAKINKTLGKLRKDWAEKKLHEN
ncbi:hypothetical protein EG829_24155 [bacterium]|nr:hypothetical protein [bacterium]